MSLQNDEEKNAMVAFALVLGAAASTGLGAAVVFFPSLVKMASRRVLAGSLGFSAGVMTYVSFVEIFGKATLSFVDAGHEENLAYIYSTCCFFGGVVCMILLNVAVHSLVDGHDHHHDHDHHLDEIEAKDRQSKQKSSRESVDQDITAENTTLCCGGPDAVHQLQTFQRMASVLEHEQNNEAEANESKVVIIENILGNNNSNNLQSSLHDNEEKSSSSNVDKPSSDKAAEELSRSEDKQEQAKDDKTAAPSDLQDESYEAKKLKKMGLNTALAIGLHNFPEGLATFVAALHDPAVGAVLAVAIAIHNIPEGLCVALPIYYATGNRLKAFLWALLSGASEIVAALLGWLILANVVTDVTYAVLFGLVSGMMVIISVKELLPTAHQYDPKDTVVTYCFIAGMALMALSLVLFKI